MCLSDADIKEHVKQIEKAVQGKEPRFVLRALRALPSTSRRLNPNVLHKAMSGFFTANAASKEFLLGFLDEVPNLTSFCSSAYMFAVSKGVFTLVDRLLCSESGIKIIKMLLFILGVVRFHTAKFLNGPKLLIQVTCE